MSDGKWSGSTANRAWTRPGSRYHHDGLTTRQRHDLYDQHATDNFWCDTCEMPHPLSEHRACRAAARAAITAST
jgi:hypothetical protein